MTILKRLKALSLVMFIAATPFTSWAGDGHDHGEAPASAAGSALPRFVAVSETFELVGVLHGKQLTLYLDRTTDNSPVKNAKLELELGGVKVDTQPHGEGVFEATLTQELQPGLSAVAATVIAGDDTDLLAGELDIHTDAHADVSAGGSAWQRYGAWAVGGLLALALLAWGFRRVRARQIQTLGSAT
ncbi:hypothetical protein [Polaromonas sp. SM01]|uniref:hypothetical protein n=1 Tax=Polaromonas sp. SM01 TaxID=3085630 RepID=UPI002981BB48|nr:hypothetical protein [Polaromonas sp. SM01]MDW5441517.1 hypothetical protein [Polaromonas sp. SM01]